MSRVDQLFIWEGRAAIAEIHRILKPNGIAVLPVPILGETTVDYPQPVSTEGGRVCAPGRDYFTRYEELFRTVTLYTSTDFPERHQLYVYEDRTVFPNELAPIGLRWPGSGTSTTSQSASSSSGRCAYIR